MTCRRSPERALSAIVAFGGADQEQTHFLLSATTSLANSLESWALVAIRIWFSKKIPIIACSTSEGEPIEPHNGVDATTPETICFPVACLLLCQVPSDRHSLTFPCCGASYQTTLLTDPKRLASKAVHTEQRLPSSCFSKTTQHIPDVEWVSLPTKKKNVFACSSSIRYIPPPTLSSEVLANHTFHPCSFANCSQAYLNN